MTTTVTTPPTLTVPPVAPTRADPATFAARGDATMSYISGVMQPELTSAMAWTKTTADNTKADLDVAYAAGLANAAANAATAVEQAALATTNGQAQVNSAAAQVALAAAQAAAAASSAASTAGVVAAAQAYATLAQATNPDSPVRLNPRNITANLTIASGYNADSVGPIRVADGVSVVVGDNATWCVS